MSAGIHKFIVEQGATFRRTITYKVNKNPVNLTGWSARMQVRVPVGRSTSRPFHDKSLILSLTTSNGGLTLGGAAGTIVIYISPQTSSTIPAGEYVYDLELESAPTEVVRLLQGNFVISEETTI